VKLIDCGCIAGHLPLVICQCLTLAAIQLHIRFVLAERNKEVVVVFVTTATWVGISRIRKRIVVY